MRNYMTRKALITSIAVGIIIFVIVFAGTKHFNARTNGIGICLVCHELFVPYDEYKGADYNRTNYGVGVGCAECHMYPYEEFKKSPHYANANGIRPSCTACHEPHTFTQIVRWKFLYINKGGYGESPFHKLLDSLRDKPEWEETRTRLAKGVREGFLKNNSQKCWDCHGARFDARLKNIKAHKRAIDKKKPAPAGSKQGVERLNCIECHYNLVHAEVPWPEMEGGGKVSD